MLLAVVVAVLGVGAPFDIVQASQRGVETDTETIRIEAHIDGRSQLILRGSTAQWHHFDYAAPGRELGVNEPTRISGVDWFPVWPDLPTAENLFCDCFSDVFSGVGPSVPATDATVELRIVQSRHVTTLVQQPSAQNDYTLIIEFDDNPPGGPDWYIVEVDVTVRVIPTTGRTANTVFVAAFVLAVGAVLSSIAAPPGPPATQRHGGVQQ
jgi:hypothetical protein